MELFSAVKNFGGSALQAGRDVVGSVGGLADSFKAKPTPARGPIGQTMDKAGAAIGKQAEAFGKTDIAQNAAKFGKQAKAAGGEAFGAVRGAYHTVDMGAKNAVKSVLGVPFKLTGHVAGETAKGTAKATASGVAKSVLWAAERPAVAGLKFGGWGLKSVGAAFKAKPALAWGATAVAAIAGLGMTANRKAHAGSAAYYQQKAAEMQAQSYMNSVTPAEAAAMHARMGGQGSFADAAQQSQANGQGANR